VILFVVSAILRFVFLNRFVINVVSLPVIVNDTHLCVALSVCCGGGMSVGGYFVCVGVEIIV